VAKTYVVKKPVKHDGTRYKPGDPISGLSTDDVAYLMDHGVIEVDESTPKSKKSKAADEEKPVGENPKGETEAEDSGKQPLVPDGVNPQLAGGE
jgi:hypothetical protein